MDETSLPWSLAHSNITMDTNTWYTGDIDNWPTFAVRPETYHRFVFIGNVILSPFICTFGIIGNSIGIYVIRQDPDSRKLSIYTYLLSLMMFDIALLFVGVVANINDFLTYMDIKRNGFLIKYCPVCKGYLIVLLKHVTAILLAVMSAERWMALAFPYSVKHFYLSKYPKVVIAISFIFSATYIIPFYAGSNSKPILNDQNETIYIFYVDKDYFPIFFVYTYIETTVLHYIAPSTIIFFNILIIITYARVVKERAAIRKSNMSHNQGKITLIVTCVAGFYILLSLPNIFVQTLIFVDEDYSFYGNHISTFKFFIDLGDLLSRVNAAADIFLYVLVSNRFRRVFHTIIRHNMSLGSSSKGESSTGCTKKPASDADDNGFAKF